MKEQINRTKHAEELFAAAGFSKQKMRGQIWFVSLKFSIGFDLIALLVCAHNTFSNMLIEKELYIFVASLV